MTLKIHLHSEYKIHGIRSHVSDFTTTDLVSKLAFYYLHKYACIYKTMSVFVQKIWSLSLSTLCQVAKKRSGAGNWF